MADVQSGTTIGLARHRLQHRAVRYATVVRRHCFNAFEIGYFGDVPVVVRQHSSKRLSVILFF